MAESQNIVNVYYIFDKHLREATDNIPKIKLRSAVVHSLIKSYNLLQRCQIIPITAAGEEDLLTFHSTDYVKHLQKAQASQDLEKMEETEDNVEFNLEYDCPLFDNIFDFAKMIAGGTLTAARLICPNKPQKVKQKEMLVDKELAPKSYLKYKQKQAAEISPAKQAGYKISEESGKENFYDVPGNLTMEEDALLASALTPCKQNRPIRVLQSEPVTSIGGPQPIAINWFGGWHHAQRDAAEGFCYVNDIVIGIQCLLKSFGKVLYVDLDVHHGNGVENAFAHTPHVMTLSLHKYGPGYYPGTGSVEDVGIGPGKFYTVNVPLMDGITDSVYVEIFSAVANKIKTVYAPDCLVVQCGADCLAGDPLGGFNLTLSGLGSCVSHLLKWKLPTVLLGGGGYKVGNAARCYAYLTSIVLGVPISNDIPENDFFHLFGPGFELAVTPSLRKNENTPAYLESILKRILSNLDNIAASPKTS